MKYLVVLASLATGTALSQSTPQQSCFQTADSVWAAKTEFFRLISDTLTDLDADVVASAYQALLRHKRMCSLAQTPEEMREAIDTIHSHGQTFITSAADAIDRLKENSQ